VEKGRALWAKRCQMPRQPTPTRVKDKAQVTPESITFTGKVQCVDKLRLWETWESPHLFKDKLLS
jgi:hypothetical protein